jgi:hypothetical protein
LLPCVLSICILATIPFVKPSDRIWIVFLFLLFAGLSLPMLLKAFMFRVVLSDEGMEAYSPWRKPRIISWSDVSGYTLSNSGCLRIETGTKGRLVLTGNISGVGSLLEELRRRKVKEIF